MRLLGALLRLVGVRCLGHELLAILLANQFAHLGHGVVRDLGRVGTHVGNESDGTFLAEINAFIQALGDHHGAFHAETQLARGILLELAGGKRGCRTAAALALLNRANAPVGALRGSLDFGCIFAVRDGSLLVADSDEPGRESRRLGRVQMGVNGPILFLDERLDVTIALNDEAQGHGLHASGGYSTTHFVPQQRRDLVPDQPIKHAAGLLRIHQVMVDVARM